MLFRSPGRQRLALRERSHGTGRRTIDTPGAGPVGQLVAGEIVAWSWLSATYRTEQMTVGLFFYFVVHEQVFKYLIANDGEDTV